MRSPWSCRLQRVSTRSSSMRRGCARRRERYRRSKTRRPRRAPWHGTPSSRSAGSVSRTQSTTHGPRGEGRRERSGLSDNDLLNRVMVVFAYLCDEVKWLENRRGDFYGPLLVFGEVSVRARRLHSCGLWVSPVTLSCPPEPGAPPPPPSHFLLAPPLPSPALLSLIPNVCTPPMPTRRPIESLFGPPQVTT